MTVKGRGVIVTLFLPATGTVVNFRRVHSESSKCGEDRQTVRNGDEPRVVELSGCSLTTLPESFSEMAAGTAHPLNQTTHLDDCFQADRRHPAALTEVASKILCGWRLNSHPGTDKDRNGFRLTLHHLLIQATPPIRPILLILCAQMAAVKVAKLVDKSRILLLARLVGVEQQFVSHANGFALLFDKRSLWQMEHVSGILNRFVEFTVFFSAMNCEWIRDSCGLRNVIDDYQDLKKIL